MAPSVINVKEYETLLVPSKSQEYIGKSNSFVFKKNCHGKRKFKPSMSITWRWLLLFPLGGFLETASVWVSTQLYDWEEGLQKDNILFLYGKKIRST